MSIKSDRLTDESRLPSSAVPPVAHPKPTAAGQAGSAPPVAKRPHDSKRSGVVAPPVAKQPGSVSSSAGAGRSAAAPGATPLPGPIDVDGSGAARRQQADAGDVNGLDPDWQENRVKRLLRTGLIGRALRWLVVDQPSWLTSFLAHALLLFLLAMMLIHQPENGTSLTLSFATNGDEVLELDSISLEPAGSQANDSPQPVTELMEPEAITVPDVVMAPLPTVHDVTTLPANLATTQVGDTAASAPGGVAGRQGRRGMAIGLGATAESEAAVDRALRWLALHQQPDGGWSFALQNCNCNKQCRNAGFATQATNGATAMALLPFLGAGHTHERGYFRKTVEDGLLYLIKNQNSSNGSFLEPVGKMYSHGLATLALSEALAMSTSDPGAVHNRTYRKQPRLRSATTKAVKFIEKAQHPQGGWRYNPKERGDTSVVGWQVMALKSAEMAGITVAPKTYQTTDKFLNSVQSGDYGQFYGYMSHEPRPGTTSIGLLCRMYRGWGREHLGIVQGAEYLDREGPAVENVYYNYYATQVLHHYGGPLWESWHPLLRDHLVSEQELDGHESGSWYFNDSVENAGLLSGGINNVGGRLYVTSLSTMILEVYYRHMPIYSRNAVPERDRLRDRE